MKNYIVALATVAFLVGCDGGSGNNDGSIGPSSSDYSRGGLTSYGYGDYQAQTVEIEAISYITTHGTVVDIALSDDGMVAYLASGEGGLEVIDISIPESPRLVYSYDLPEYINYVEVRDGRVYAANVYQRQERYFKLYAFDTYNPYNPQYIGYDNGQNGVGHSRVKVGNYLYEVGQDGLAIHHEYNSIYYPAGSFYIPGTSYAVAVRANYIFIANGHDGLKILRANVGGTVGHVH
jgi:hypothetical protein